MKKFTKAFFLGATTFAIGFAGLTPMITEARSQQGYQDDYGNYDDQGYEDQNYGDQGGNDQAYGDQGSYANQGNDMPEAPAGPNLNVSVEMNLSGEYGQMLNREKGKYEIFLRALNNLKDSTKGSKPARISLDGGDATFEGMENDPQGLLVAVSRVGNNYQFFCHGQNVKDGVIKGFPQNITVVLKNGNKPYKKADNTLRNDSYPNCEVVVGN